MPRKKKQPVKEDEDVMMEEEEEKSDDEHVEAVVEEPNFMIDDSDEIKPFTNDYDFIIQFDSLEKLPEDVVFEIFTFLPAVPYYFSLQRLSKYYQRKFKFALSKSQHLDLSSMQFATWMHSRDPKLKNVYDLIDSCKDCLKSIKLPRLYLEQDACKNQILTPCTQLNEITFVFPTQYFTQLFSNQYGRGYYYAGYASDMPDHDKTNRNVWSNSLKVLNILGLEKPRKSRRHATYNFNAAALKHILERFPALAEINFIFSSYQERDLRSLFDRIKESRKQLLSFRESKTKSTIPYISGNWYEEAAGYIDFEFNQDLKINVIGNIGRLNTLEAAKTLCEKYNINPNTELSLTFSNATYSGTLLDQIIGKKVAYKQKHQIIAYLLAQGSQLTKLSCNSWMGLLSQKNGKIEQLLAEITKYAKKHYSGKMMTHTTFSQLMQICHKKQIPIARSLEVMYENGWSDLNDPDNDYVSAAILNKDVLEFMVEKAGCSLTNLKDCPHGTALMACFEQNLNSLPVVLSKVPEQLSALVGPDTFTNRPTAFIRAIRSSTAIPDVVIQHILDNYSDHIDFDMKCEGTKDTLLHEMISAQRTECVRTLLAVLKEKEKLEGIINAKNSKDETPLFLACSYRFIQLAVDMVKNYGADPNILNETSMEYPYERAKAGGFFVPSTGFTISSALISIPDELKPEKPLSKEKRQAMALKKLQKKYEEKNNEKNDTSEEQQPLDEDEDDDDESKPRRSKRKSARNRKTYTDDVMDTLSAEEQEEEEEKPKKTKGRKKKAAKASEDEESEKEETPKKKKAASKRKKEEETNEDENENEENAEEEEQPKKKKKQTKPRTSRKKK
ncbi:hypothetical protein C9374_009325 [Naegleria lovaniensis]|uniref:Uncharacterized protein n=1 Tax=Naegleria lovaniensis TaxID=51637 RepID=A0AA88KK28_NAELO|nr:uncharacterized protein C9374_009325 [Naegleria lovaniensis]KAG2377414.1 hypothetical protein C9374_009325 [Naegleria lovaniensis]